MSLCERFHCPPSVLDEEDATIIRLARIYDLGHPPEKTPTPTP